MYFNEICGDRALVDNMLDVLIRLAPLVNELATLEPFNVDDLPNERLKEFKQLEELALVSLRNKKTCALQRQRLVKIIQRESRSASSPKRQICLSAYEPILRCNSSK